MKTAIRQRGISFIVLMFAIVAFLFLAILGMKTIPAYLENGQIVKLFKAVAADPAMQNAANDEVLSAYSKRASIDSVKAISEDDIQVSRAGGKLVLSADYTLKLPVIANISLQLEFHPSSAD